MPVKWQTDFSKTQPTSEAHWKNGVLPADLPEKWIPNAATGTFWLEVTNDETGAPAIHCHSEDAGARYDIMNTKLYGFDYQKNYVLQAQVKAENVNGTGFYMRAMVGSSANKNLGDGYKVKGTTDGWVLYEIPLQNLAEVAGDNADRMKVEVFFEKFTGDVWVKDLKIVEDYKLSLDKTELTGQVGDVITLNVTADSDKVDLSKLVWTSSDPEIAAVENGTVTIKSVGVATITASMDDTHRVSCTITVDDPAMMEMYATMRKRWTDRQTGNDCVDKNDPDYKAAMASYAEKAQSAWDTLIKDEDRTTLWPDLDLTHKWVKPGQTDGTLTEGMNTASVRIMDMARAWAAEGCEEYGLYHNEELGRDIVEALDWFHANVYNENYDLKKIYGSWWHFWIGVPQNIASACVLMYDEMSPELRASEYATLRHFNEDPTKIVNVWGSYNEQTGANLADTCLVAALRSAVGNNQEGIGLATKHAASLTVNVTSGDGFYEDGSFIQHNNLGYTAGYGSALLKGIEKILYLSNDTAWEMPEESVANVYNWIWNGYRPLYADGAMMDMTTGRGVARPTRTDMGAGRTILEGIVLLADSAPEEMKLPIQIFAKENLIAGAKYSETFYSDMAPASMVAAKKIVNDPNIPSEMTDADEAYYSKVFGVMDKFVAHSEDFSMGISYSSARTGRFEVGNKENIKGWHQGDGVTYMYNGDQNQYSDGYWATIDPQRLPGITTDHNTWTLDTMNAWGKYTGNGIFNGGSTVGPYASVAMDFKNYGSDGSQNPDLAAHKSWFVFDDEVVALGAGITGMKEGRDTETIVENKKINGTNQLVVDGKAVAPNLGDEATLNGVSWAWMEGNKGVDSMGYYFPEGSDVNVLREARTGRWTDVNASAGISDEEITRNYLSLAIPHGENGNSKGEEGYSYVLLPSMKQEQVKSYSENPDIKVLSNTSAVQAVMDTGINASGYNFWQAGQVQLGEQASAFTGVKASQPASVTVAEEGGVLTVGISDPTQKNASTVIRLEGEGLSVGQLDEGVTAQADATGVTLTVNTDGGYGQTFTATVHNTGKVIDDTLEEGDDFLNSDVTTADRADAQALLGRLESLDESQLTAEQAARRTRMMEQLSRMLTDMDTVDKVVTDLNGVQEVTGDNLEQVKAMLAAYDGLTTDQKALLTSEQKAVAEKVRDMVKSYEEGIEPTPSPDPTPTPGTDPTPTPAPDPTPTPKPEDKPSEGGQDGSGTNATPAPTAVPSASAQTGDGFRPVALGLMGMASAAAVVVLSVMKKKMSDEE